ncbi:MAG: bifunctional anthranilate synthase component II/anthranilate phosphoribosyltransferase [Anaerolineae bacterium]|nr:bifunctional anthranilate synthase component II/anthranilate phosphoribosyltransferase [Anaerolineae bacterium]
MIIVIDNYDSFTYNLVQYLGELGAEPWVFRNDEITLGELSSMQPSHIVISPGPGTPEKDAGISNQVIRRFHGQVPILGVCLGHQCIAHTFGARVGRASQPKHGKVSRIIHQGGELFAGIPTSFEATRYHSLIVQEPLPPELQVLARSPDGEIMALRHRQAPTFGVQFHPESILTPYGKKLLENFISLNRSPSPTFQKTTTETALSPREALERLLMREHLSAAEAESIMTQIMEGKMTEVQIGALLTALRAKGETIPEITGFVRAMRKYAIQVPTHRYPLLDTCGTGGDGACTFNISTTTALVVAGAGVAVAKHGNRSVSSQCGSADVLLALGVNLDLSPEEIGECIDQVGFGFLFAPKLHPAMKHAIGPRRELGVRTVFNVLGPLTNPAGATSQLLGVYDAALVEPLAQVLGELGSERAYVVHSSDGLDELSLAGPNIVAQLQGGQVQLLELDPSRYGFARYPSTAIRGGDAMTNARITTQVLEGSPGPHRETVLLNASLALLASGVAQDLAEGIERAQESIDSGRALRVLKELVAFTEGKR